MSSASSLPPSEDHSLTCLNVARHRLNTWRPREDYYNISTLGTHSASVKDIEGAKKALSELGVDLPSHVLDKLTNRYDGMIPMQRNLAEEGCWSSFSDKRRNGNDEDMKLDIDA